MILTWERQEKISCYRLYDLKMNFEEENRGCAQEIFDDDMAQAEQAQVLKRRAVVVAHLVGEAMSSYARSHSPLDDPWMAWRREPADEPAGEFVHSLKEEEFFCARVAYHIYAATNIRRPEYVPSDGDLEDIPGYLETEYVGTWPQWLEVLGPARDAAVLYPASAAAKQDLEERPAHSDSKVERELADLKDKVLSFQMPTIERLESIGAKVDALGAPDRFKAEQFLKDTLGVEVYS
jgi:hypothetical protein